MSHSDAERFMRFAPTARPAEETLLVQSRHRFRVHTKAYCDPAVFEAEMERVFGRTWIYVGHASEIPDPGDFKSTTIGLQPVIVVRGEDRAIRVLVNRCVHRGAVVTREVRGNVPEFLCPYHGWVFDLAGKLVAISERRDPGGYGPNFEAPAGLHVVPKVDSYRGFVFACLDPAAPPLAERLGNGRRLIDRKLDMSPVGEIELKSRPYVARYPGNWKFQAENIVDAYHFMHTHKGFVALQARYGDSTGDFGLHKGGDAKKMHDIRFQGHTWNFEGGHALLERPSVGLDDDLAGPFGAYWQGLLDRHGADEMRYIHGKVAGTVFPNMGMIHQQIRVWRPIAPDLTEVTVYPYELKGAPAEFNAGMLRSQERFYGPSGYGQSDDVDIFMRNQQGLAGSAVEWLIIERGLESDEQLANGDVRGMSASEAPQRALWREWQRLMSER